MALHSGTPRLLLLHDQPIASSAFRERPDAKASEAWGGKADSYRYTLWVDMLYKELVLHIDHLAHVSHIIAYSKNIYTSLCRFENISLSLL